MGKYEDRVAIVTGASRGIGRATALEFANEGAHVIVNFRSQSEAAEAVVAEITQYGCQAIAVQADVTSEAEVRMPTPRSR